MGRSKVRIEYVRSAGGLGTNSPQIVWESALVCDGHPRCFYKKKNYSQCRWKVKKLKNQM